MRFEGKLEKWNDERGFGFIAPLRGGDPVFVHVSAFVQRGARPQVGDEVTFLVEPTADGKKRAMDVRRSGVHASRHAAGRTPVSSKPRSHFLLGRLMAVLVVVCLAAFAYTRYAGHAQALLNPPAPELRQGEAAPVTARFSCDGRTHCSQMTSCEEAKFFLRHCPGTKMDGNNDGIPCEQQWCTSPFAR